MYMCSTCEHSLLPVTTLMSQPETDLSSEGIFTVDVVLGGITNQLSGNEFHW